MPFYYKETRFVSWKSHHIWTQEINYDNTNKSAKESTTLGRRRHRTCTILQKKLPREREKIDFSVVGLVMISMRIGALLVSAVAASLIVVLEGMPLEENHQMNAFDKIVKADLPIGEIKNSRHEVDMILPKLKKSRSKRSLESDPPSEYYSTVQLWPGGRIPYTISYDLKNNKYYNLIKEAIKEYENKTCLKFVERSSETNYLEFYSGPGCQSDVGYQGNGIQTLSLGENCDSLSIVIHEMGHAIGLYHEQNRPDRDKYIKVLWDNIQPSFRRAYQIKSGWHPESVKTPYDYYSVMHYGNKDFRLKPGLVTMESKKPGITFFGGNKLSGLDAKRVRKMYRCPEYPEFPRDFYWSHDGRGMKGKTCLKMDEPRDPNSWNNNFLCYRNQGKKPLTLRWSNRGPISGMSCTNINEPSKPSWTSWDDNYLCVPFNSPYKFKWLTTRPSSQDRANCRKLNEPRDRDWTRGYHYLCATDRETDKTDGQWSQWGSWGTCSKECDTGYQRRLRDCNNPYPANGGKSCVGSDYQEQQCNTQPCAGLPTFPEDFSYTYNQYSIPNGNCLRTYDILNYFKWFQYYFCTSLSKSDPDIWWSYNGPRPGKRCTRIYNPIENMLRRGSWMNNYLCVPMDSPYHFVWSLKGPINGLPCMRWYAQNGRNGWDKTYLCNKKKSTSAFAYHN